MTDVELARLLDRGSGVPVVLDRREGLRDRIEQRSRVLRRQTWLVAAAVAMLAVGGMMTVRRGASPTLQVTGRAGAVMVQRTTSAGDDLTVFDDAPGEISVHVAGVVARGSGTGRPVGVFRVLDPPDTTGVAVTGATLTDDAAGRPLVILVVHVAGPVSAVRATQVPAAHASAATDAAVPVDATVVLVLRPDADVGALPDVEVSVEALDAAGNVTGQVLVRPFVQRPLTCATNTVLFTSPSPSTLPAQPATTTGIQRTPIAPPLPALCPGD